MKILITGAGGQLGTELRRQLAKGECSIGTIPERLKRATIIPTDLGIEGMETLDITNRHEVAVFVRHHKPDVIISCAAFTNVDGCETNRDAAFQVNALGARNLAMAAQEVDAKLLHVSTDYVFSGADNGQVPLDETALVAPVSAYGETKRLGEEYVRVFCQKHFIVRTAWLYGYVGKNFVYTMMNAGKKLGALTVVDDQRGNPTNAEDLAYHLLKLCVTKEYGTYHCTGEEVCSWCDFAKEIIRLAGVEATVTPCTSQEYAQKNPQAATRPVWSALENRMLACTVGNEMRPWKQALACFFENCENEKGK